MIKNKIILLTETSRYITNNDKKIKKCGFYILLISFFLFCVFLLEIARNTKCRL